MMKIFDVNASELICPPDANIHPSSRKVYICGRVYELNGSNAAAIERKIQNRINHMVGSKGLIKFLLTVDDDLEMVDFEFISNNLFRKIGVNHDFINDSDAQLIMGMGKSYRPPVMWQFVEPFAPSRYNIPFGEFVDAYTRSAIKEGASHIRAIKTESLSDRFILKIILDI